MRFPKPDTLNCLRTPLLVPRLDRSGTGAIAQPTFASAGRYGHCRHQDDDTGGRDSQGIWSYRAEVSNSPCDAQTEWDGYSSHPQPKRPVWHRPIAIVSHCRSIIPQQWNALDSGKPTARLRRNDRSGFPYRRLLARAPNSSRTLTTSFASQIRLRLPVEIWFRMSASTRRLIATCALTDEIPS